MACSLSAEPYPVPQFSFYSTKLHADVRVPQPGSWISDVEGGSDEEGKWEKKGDERLLRKAMIRGCIMRSRLNGNAEVLFSDTECEGGENGKRVRVVKVKKMGLNHGMLDIVFAGSPNQ
ncbi:hypothetical protein AZE42_07839 [Rhizopogon vesiculosus]|uniref:Uncharacterized protein n=1 Tax=Rhizopogon vesiculosus TaxID=180088 RepID=A0A1J8PM53_9AGAM|nr:hypothetical protein AZE42_07839 [Rhizopogon vesiculosus]